jgi:hypothetical protein
VLAHVIRHHYSFAPNIQNLEFWKTLRQVDSEKHFEDTDMAASTWVEPKQEEILSFLENYKTISTNFGPKKYRSPEPGTATFAKYIDHTLLKLDATEDQIDQVCEEAKLYNFKVRISSS